MDCKQVLLELKCKKGNNVCADCNSPDPQWADINYGIFLCSKCFDVHRSIDENSVRSLNIDNWTEDQIIRMKLGGNNRAIKYFKSQPEYHQNISIEEKYKSNFAKSYSEKLTKKCQEQIDKTQLSLNNSFSSCPSCNDEQENNNDDDENDENEIKDNNDNKDTLNNTNESLKNENINNDNNSPGGDNNWENIYLYNSDPTNILDPNLKEYDNITLLRVYRPSKERNEEYFERKGRENEKRREDIPPSQGGKYTGFGSKPLRLNNGPQNESLAHFQKSISSGWNFLATTVNSLNNNIIKPASNAVRDPNFSKNIENYAENIKRSLAEKAYIAKGQIDNAKDHISIVVQNLQKTANGTASNSNGDRDDLMLSNLEGDKDSSNDSKNDNGNEPFIVIDYDYIENSDNDIFCYPKSENKFLTNTLSDNNNYNDFFDRRASTNSFTSINESLNRAYSIGSTSSIKMALSNRSSSSSLNLVAEC